MTDKKFTDEEIIKGLECCIAFDCRHCPLGSKCNSSPPSPLPFKCALDLINRQNAEIERLNKKVEELSEVLSDTIKIRYKKAKAEAYKEFAKKLKNILRNTPKWNVKKLNFTNVGFSYDDVFFSIENLLKEMVGEKT